MIRFSRRALKNSPITAAFSPEFALYRPTFGIRARRRSKIGTRFFIFQILARKKVCFDQFRPGMKLANSNHRDLKREKHQERARRNWRCLCKLE